MLKNNLSQINSELQNLDENNVLEKHGFHKCNICNGYGYHKKEIKW